MTAIGCDPATRPRAWARREKLINALGVSPSTAVATNVPPHGAFRGFGAPQTHFANERHMDVVAATIDLDPSVSADTVAKVLRTNGVPLGKMVLIGTSAAGLLDLHAVADHEQRAGPYRL